MSLSFSIGAVIFLIVGLFFLGVAGHMHQQQRARRRRGLPATAVIVGFRPARSEQLPLVRFTTAAGHSVETNTESGVAVGQYAVGQPLSIIYDPANPKNADLAGAVPTSPVWLLMMGLIFTGVALLQLLGIVPVFDAHRHNW